MKIITRGNLIFPKKFVDEVNLNAAVLYENLEVLPYNIYRSAESIFDSIIYLLLLADSRILYISQSTFLELCEHGFLEVPIN